MLCGFRASRCRRRRGRSLKDSTRNTLLIAALVCSLIVLGKATFAPAKPQPLPSYSFPQQAPTVATQFPEGVIAGWQFVQATPIAVAKLRAPALATSLDDLTVSGQQYQYQRNGTAIAIEMRYFVDTYTDASEILKDATIFSRRVNFTVERSSRGSYAQFQADGTRHIAACLTPTGETSVTNADLRGSQNHPSVLVQRFTPWFLGQAPLRDLRCLWIHVSAPDSIDQAELKQIFSTWVGAWQTQYPSEPKR